MPRVASTNGLTLDQLEQMIRGRRVQLGKLQRQRVKLARKLDQMDERIRHLGGRGRPGGRARNDQSLLVVIESVLKGAGKPMKVGDITEAVGSRGYRSNSVNFRGIVNQTLIKDKRFAQASRGLYQLKK